MKLPREKLLQGCQNQSEIEALIDIAEKSLRYWEANWSVFLSEPIQAEALKKMRSLTDLKWETNGGYAAAERRKLLCIPFGIKTIFSPEDVPISGIRIEGNFLFDKPNQNDLRKAIRQLGVESNQIGDIWICNDRGAEAICSKDAAAKLNGISGQMREVIFKCEGISLSDLRLPLKRNPKKFTTVEASKRIDAIASAGFGLSRAKITKQIQQGRLRLNWLPTHQTSRELKEGDTLQLEEKGSIEVISMRLTKRERWRIELLRK